MKNWVITDVRGWFSSDQKLPPHTGEEVLMWYPEDGNRIHSSHAKPTSSCSVEAFKRQHYRYTIKDLRWMPQGFRVEGTFWRRMPKPPKVRWEDEE